MGVMERHGPAQTCKHSADRGVPHRTTVFPAGCYLPKVSWVTSAMPVSWQLLAQSCR